MAWVVCFFSSGRPKLFCISCRSTAGQTAALERAYAQRLKGLDIQQEPRRFSAEGLHCGLALVLCCKMRTHKNCRVQKNQKGEGGKFLC